MDDRVSRSVVEAAVRACRRRASDESDEDYWTRVGQHVEQTAPRARFTWSALRDRWRELLGSTYAWP
jgi:hypothetical protein